jgi:MFS family permease
LLVLGKIHYGWVVVASAFFIFSTNALAIYGFGVFLTPQTQEFNWERGELSAAFSAGILVAGCLASISGRISDRYGPRIMVTAGAVAMAVGFALMSLITALWQAYLIWGVFLGVGIGGTVTPINTNIPRWFSAKTGLAIAIPGAGFGVGSVVAPLLIQWLLGVFDWRMTFIVIGIIRLVVALPAAMFMRRDPSDMGIKPYGDTAEGRDIPAGSNLTGFSFTEAMKSRRFWLFAMIHFGFGFYLQMVIVHIVPNAIDVGIAAVAAAAILSVMAGSSVLGMLCAGFVAERMGSLRLMGICLLVMTLAIIWLLFAHSTWMLFLFAGVFGFFNGSFLPLLTLVPMRIFGMKSLGSIFGIIMLLGTLGGAIGAPMSGLIFDVTGNYNIAFIVAACIGVMTIVFSLLLRRYLQQPARS